MKRAQNTGATPTSAEGPVLKKTKMADVADDTGGNWTKIEKRKKKKAAKNEARVDFSQPRFMYSNHEIIKRNHSIGIEDIRDFALHLVADAPPPNWLRVENAQLIQKVVVLMVPGLTNDMLGIAPIPTNATTNPNIPLSIPLLSSSSSDMAAAIPFIATTFSHACPTRAPGDQNRMHSVMSSFFNSVVTQEEKKRRMNQRMKSERIKEDPTQYLLTLEQMVENDYPIPSYVADLFQKSAGWVETPQPAQGTLASGVKQTIYAVDCEMCMTEDGKELTRVCLIDYHSGCVVYDQLVKPPKPVTDYLTRFSGITAEHLTNITTTLADVQAHILKLLSPPAPNPFSTKPSMEPPPPTPILLGHSLESDLKALKLCHPYCLDTALMFHHPRGRPLKPGLAWLTKKWCGREIQARGEGGHDPEEDARACVDLLRRKLEEGPGFGEFKTDQESIFERMARSNRRAGGGAGTIRSAVVDYGNPAQMHGSKATTALACKSDAEVVENLLGTVGSHDFVFGRLMALADLLGWITQRANADSSVLPTPPAAATPEEINDTLRTLNTHLKAVHSSLPSRTAFLLFTGHSDPRKMTQLSSRKTAFDNALRSGKSPDDLGDLRWTSADARDLEEAVELTKRGLLFLGVKA